MRNRTDQSPKWRLKPLRNSVTRGTTVPVTTFPGCLFRYLIDADNSEGNWCIYAWRDQELSSVYAFSKIMDKSKQNRHYQWRLEYNILWINIILSVLHLFWCIGLLYSPDNTFTSCKTTLLVKLLVRVEPPSCPQQARKNYWQWWQNPYQIKISTRIVWYRCCITIIFVLFEVLP